MTSSPWRERDEEYSPDGRKIAYVSDEGGEQQVWVYDVATATRKKLTTQPAEKDNLVWAPSSQKLAYGADNKVFEVDVAGGAPRELAHNAAGGYTVSQYSADGNWLVYSRRDDEQNADVYLYDIKTKKEYNISQSPWNETNAQLTPDGKTVVFTSNRDGGANQLFAVSLSRTHGRSERPAGARAHSSRDAAAGAGRGGRGGGNADAAVDAVPRASASISTGIDRRAIQLTRGGTPSARSSCRATAARSTSRSAAVGGRGGGRRTRRGGARRRRVG